MSSKEVAKLATIHSGANDPYEPYQGVAALFNGDLRKAGQSASPREEWFVLSPYEIVFEPDHRQISQELEALSAGAPAWVMGQRNRSWKAEIPDPADGTLYTVVKSDVEKNFQWSRNYSITVAGLESEQVVRFNYGALSRQLLINGQPVEKYSGWADFGEVRQKALLAKAATEIEEASTEG
jgi:hypothetical protein